MIFSVLGRYFFVRYVITVLWFLFGVVSIIYLIDFSEVVGNISEEAGQNLVDALLITALPALYPAADHTLHRTVFGDGGVDRAQPPP